MSIDTLIGGTGAEAAGFYGRKDLIERSSSRTQVHGTSNQSSSKINNSSSVTLRTFATS